MPYPLKKPISRLSNTPLGGGFGCDRERRIVITIIPGNGADVKDTFKLKPERCRDGRAEHITVEEVYRYAIQCRVMGAKMKKLRELKAKKESKRERAKITRADRKFSTGT